MKTVLHDSSAPIGLFDSGIGGLTVAHSVLNVLPNEQLIYFGDTAHMPYGDKSSAAIQAYSVRIADLLLQEKCKLILIACNSASAAAYELVKEYVGSRAVVMNVIDPVVRYLSKHFSNKTIGLFGTRQTVASNIYRKKIDEQHCGIDLHVYATNLLAPAIEEFGQHAILDHLIEHYVASAQFPSLHALVLACTHYPIIKEQIKKQLSADCALIDASEIVATSVKNTLQRLNMQNENERVLKRRHFYVSDYTESFARNARLFFGDHIQLEHYPLWD